MYCLSLRVAQGTDDMGMYTLEFSTIDLPGADRLPVSSDPRTPPRYANSLMKASQLKS